MRNCYKGCAGYVLLKHPPPVVAVAGFCQRFLIFVDCQLLLMIADICWDLSTYVDIC